MANKTKAQKEAEAAAAAANQTPAADAPAAAPAAPPAAEPAKPSTKKRPDGISPGRIVHFHREVQSGFGSKLVALPAMILCEAAKESNFQDVDGAVDLKVFGKHGDEVQNGVMFGHDGPKARCWTFPAKV